MKFQIVWNNKERAWSDWVYLNYLNFAGEEIAWGWVRGPANYRYQQQIYYRQGIINTCYVVSQHLLLILPGQGTNSFALFFTPPGKFRTLHLAAADDKDANIQWPLLSSPLGSIEAWPILDIALLSSQYNLWVDILVQYYLSITLPPHFKQWNIHLLTFLFWKKLVNSS